MNTQLDTLTAVAVHIAPYMVGLTAIAFGLEAWSIRNEKKRSRA